MLGGRGEGEGEVTVALVYAMKASEEVEVSSTHLYCRPQM